MGIFSSSCNMLAHEAGACFVGTRGALVGGKLMPFSLNRRSRVSIWFRPSGSGSARHCNIIVSDYSFSGLPDM
jgi:hypothetical protein